MRRAVRRVKVRFLRSKGVVVKRSVVVGVRNRSRRRDGLGFFVLEVLELSLDCLGLEVVQDFLCVLSSNLMERRDDVHLVGRLDLAFVLILAILALEEQADGLALERADAILKVV